MKNNSIKIDNNMDNNNYNNTLIKFINLVIDKLKH